MSTIISCSNPRTSARTGYKRWYRSGNSFARLGSKKLCRWIAVFPGDPYVVGFLRNYAEYLGLSSDSLVAAYRAAKIQEQPVPLQALIPRRGPSPLLVAVLTVASVAVAGIVLFLVFGRGKGKEPAEAASLRHGAPVEYRVEGASLEKRFYVGDSVTVSIGSDKYKLVLAAIDETVTIDAPSGPAKLILGEEGTVDLDKNGQPEIKILVSDFAKRDPDKGALLRFERSEAEAAYRAAEPEQAAVAEPDDAGSESAVEAAQPAPVEAASPRETAKAPIFEPSKNPHPFVMSVTFRGSCFFRYEVDRRDRVELYYRKGETITVSAQNALKIWASNALSAKVVLMASGGKSADLELGGAGEVAVKRVAWTQNDSGLWALGASDVD
jgi:cytoskeleton protein RodZ